MGISTECLDISMEYPCNEHRVTIAMSTEYLHIDPTAPALKPLAKGTKYVSSKSKAENLKSLANRFVSDW